jgi:putative phage-type endonuclease
MTLALQSPVDASDREGWLRWRTSGIGSSDAAAVAGISPWATPFEIYCRKLGLAPEVEETRAMRIGTLMEPVIAQLYADETGHEIADRQVCVTHPTLPFVRATLDGLREDGRIVEFKTAGIRAAKEWGDENDAIPDYYAIQLHHQMLARDAEVADLAVLIGGQDFRIYTVERYEPTAARLIELESEFWDRVQRRDPPPATAVADARLYACLYPDPEGETDLGDAGRIQAMNYEECGREIKRLEEARERAKLELLAALGPHQTGLLPDGRRVKRSVIPVAERVQTIKAHLQTRISISKGTK